MKSNLKFNFSTIINITFSVFLIVLVSIVFLRAHNAHAAQLYYNSFDSQTVGSTPTGFTAISPAVFQVSTTSPITRKYSVIDTNTADAHIGLLTSVAAQTSMAAQLSEVIHLPSTLDVSSYSLILQSDISAQNYYMVFLALSSNQIIVYKRSGGGSLTQVGSTISYPFYDNEQITLKGDVNNGTIIIKVWSPGGYEPTASTTVIDSSPLTNAGYAGVRKTISGSPTTPSFDDFFMGDSGTTFSQIQVSSETLAWQNRTNIISPQGTGFEQYQVLEPTRPIWDGTQWVMYYTGSNHVNDQIGRMTSPDLVTWTRYSGNPVLGQGVGGESASASQSAAILHNGVWYLYYSTSYTPTSDAKVATSSDGIHFSNPQIIIPHGAQSWFSGLSNKGILIDDDGIWKMLFEARATASGTPWEIGLATSSDGITWHIDPDSPFLSLRLGGGSFSGPRTFVKINGVYNIWYHTSYGNVLPSDISHAVSKDLKYWTILNDRPVFYREGESFPVQGQIADQVADPSLVESGGKTYMFYDVDANIDVSNISARIDSAVYNGPMSNLGGSVNPDLTLGLDGMWTMDNTDISGTTITDKSPKGNNATLVNSPTTGVSGQIAQAVSFNGSNNYIKVPADNSLDYGTGQFAISLWMKKGANGVYGGLVSKIDSSDVSGFSLNMNADNTVGFYCVNGASVDQIYSSAITDTKWHHVVALRDGHYLKLYIDNILAGSGVDHNINVTNNFDLAIGLYRSGDTTHNLFNGAIDDVRVYDHGISSNVVNELYAYGFTPTVTTTGSSAVTASSATLTGSIDVSLATSTVRGFIYSTSSTFASGISTTTEVGNFGTGSFTANLTSLSAGTTYYFEAYASNATSTGYGSPLSFTTSAATLPTVVINSGSATSSITETSATLSATTTSTGDATITKVGFNYGLTTGYGSVASTTGTFGTGSFSESITGLTCNTTYHFQAFAVNSVGTATSSDLTFTTSACSASVYTFTGPTSGNIYSASSNFTVTPDFAYTGTITITPAGSGSNGLSPVVLTFSNSNSPQTFTVTPTVVGTITLTPTNNSSLSDPSVLNYTSDAIAPGAPTSVSAATSSPGEATVSFTVPSSNGGSNILYYIASSSPGSLTATSTGSPIVVTGLTNGTSYTFKVYAINAVGTSSASTVSNSVIPNSGVVSPTLTTISSGSITQTSVSLTGNITNAGSPAVTVRGFQYATDIHYSNAKTVFSTNSGGYTTGQYSMTVSGLTCNTTYYYAAYISTPYTPANDLNFTTLACDPTTHSLIYSASSHGSITGSTTQVVTDGSNGTAVTAVPDSGYHFVSWSDSSTSNPRTDNNIIVDHTFTAMFAADSVPVSTTTPVVVSQSAGISSSGGGRVSISTLASILAPGPETTAYLNSLNYYQSTTTHSTSLFRSFLTTGMTSDEVKNLQNILQNLGFLKHTPTGYYGPLTTEAVKAYQLAHGINPVGYVGPGTRASLNANLAQVSTTVATSTPVSFFTRDLKLGSAGQDVRSLQVYLNTHGFIITSIGAGSPGHETDIFGSLTKSALIKYQKANHIIPAVGYFGPVTRGYIESH